MEPLLLCEPLITITDNVFNSHHLLSARTLLNHYGNARN